MSKSKPRRRADAAAILARLAAALALIETATLAIESVEDQGKLASIGSQVETLRQGLAALRKSYNEIDLLVSGGSAWTR